MTKKGVSKKNKISQCESPSSEHEMSNLTKNASFSKVTVRRKPEKTLFEIVEDSVDSVTSMPLKQSYNLKKVELYKKKEKKKKKEKSSVNDNGLLSDGVDNLFKPQKKKQIIKSKTKNIFNVELDNDVPSCSLKKKKKRDKLSDQSEFINQADYDEHSIAEVVSTSLTKSPKNYESQLEDNDLQSVVHETEITHSPSAVNISESKQYPENEEKSQNKHRNKKRKNDSINEGACVVGNILLPTKRPQKKRKQQKHLEDSDNTIQTIYGEQSNTNEDLPITTLLTTKLPPSLKDGECDLKVDQEIDATSSAQVNLQLLQQTFTANHEDSLNKKNKKKTIRKEACDLDEEINKNNFKTSRHKKIKKNKKCIENSKDDQSKDDNDSNTEAELSYVLQNISSPKIIVEHKCTDLKTVSQKTEISHSSFEAKTKPSEQIYGDDNQRKKKRKNKIKSTYSEESDITNPNELITAGNSSRKKNKHHKHIDNSENVTQNDFVKHDIKEANSTSLAIVSPTNFKKTVDVAKSQLLKETSDFENSALYKPQRKKKKRDVITDLRSTIIESTTTSPKRNKKVKSSNQLKDDCQSSGGRSFGIVEVINRPLSDESSKYLSEDPNTFSSGNNKLMNLKNEKKFKTYDTTKKESTDDLLGSDSSVFKFKSQSINPTPLVNSTGASHTEAKRRKKSKRVINDTDIITARLLKNALKESGTTQNTLQKKKKKFKTEKIKLLSSSNQTTLQDCSKIIPNEHKSKIDLTRKDTKIKKNMSNKNPENEIEKITQDLLSAALKRLKTNSVDKPSDPAYLKCTEESDKSPKCNLTQTLHVSKSIKKTGNKPKPLKIGESVKRNSKLKKTKTKDRLEEITSKMLAEEALARKQT